MAQQYDYMIKAINDDMTSYGGFKYPKKGLVVAPDWYPFPVCGGGIHGLIHDTPEHYIEYKPIWIVLKYVRKETVIINNSKIKVPRAWVVFCGTAQEAQKRFGELTGKPYCYDFAVQVGGDKSKQIAGQCSTQTAGAESIQIAGNGSTQLARYSSIQVAGYKSTQIAGYWSTQTAKDGSICIINGAIGYCKHDIQKGESVLQVLRFYRGNKVISLTKLITDNKKYKLEVVKVGDGWELRVYVVRD